MGDGFGPGVADFDADRDGFDDAAEDDAEGDGSGRCVDEETGDAASPSSVAITGSACGGSYAVPDITVCTPHHDSVTAAPVASSHATECTSPRRTDRGARGGSGVGVGGGEESVGCIAGHTAPHPPPVSRTVHRHPGEA